MHDWWKEIHKNVNFSGGNIIYVKRSGQPWGNPPADSDSVAATATVTANAGGNDCGVVDWIAIGYAV